MLNLDNRLRVTGEVLKSYPGVVSLVHGESVVIVKAAEAFESGAGCRVSDTPALSQEELFRLQVEATLKRLL